MNALAHARELVPIGDINIEDRIRTAQNNVEVQRHILDLADSITRFGGFPTGLLQPPIVDETNTLQDGWCRYSACRQLGWTHLPVYRREKLSESDYREIELETNLRRLGFTWQEQVKAVCEIHRTRRRAAVLTGKKWTMQMTGDLVGGYSDSYVANCIEIEPHLVGKVDSTLGQRVYDEEVTSCETITDALRVIYRRKEDKAVQELARRTMLMSKAAPAMTASGTAMGQPMVTPATTDADVLGSIMDGQPTLITPNPASTEPPVEQVIDLSSTLFHGDSARVVLPLWPAECVNHILTDSPYGIDVENLQQQSEALIECDRIKSTHNVDENLALFHAMMPQFYRVLKPGGFFVTFCDVMNWQLLYDLATAAGFGVQRWPLIWWKQQGKCQMANTLTTKDYEMAIVCRKGVAVLPRPVTSSIIVAKNDEVKKSNPFAKPFLAWKWLYDAFTLEGQTVLEPFAGEGSGVVAGLKLNRRVLAIEKDDTHWPYLIENVKSHWKGVFKDRVKFV